MIPYVKEEFERCCRHEPVAVLLDKDNRSAIQNYLCCVMKLCKVMKLYKAALGVRWQWNGKEGEGDPCDAWLGKDLGLVCYCKVAVWTSP